MDFCILSAGIGSRFRPFSDYANKTLAPFPYEPIISQLINSIPKENRIIVVTGYLNKDLESIIKDIHSDREILVRQNMNYLNTGMGDSLMNILDELTNSFIVLPNDGIYKENLLDINHDQNADLIIGSSIKDYKREDYTKISCDSNDNVKGIYRDDIKYCVEDNDFHEKIFTGYLYVKNKEIYKNYLLKYKSGEREIYYPIKDYIQNKKIVKSKNFDWIDCGTYSKYKNELKKIVDYDFSKTEETLLIYQNRKVYKIFKDSQISQKRLHKSKLYNNAFPKCHELPSRSGYSYNFMEGSTMYEKGSSKNLMNLLNFLENNLWTIKRKKNTELLKDGEFFYKEKTLSRINLLSKKYELDKIKNINNQDLNYISVIPPFEYDSLVENIHISPIHGDLQYDNIIFHNNNFNLIDWRHEFGRNIEFGDLYYDLAKLLGGILINYKVIKKGEFFAELTDHNTNINYQYKEDHNVVEQQQIIYDFHFKNNLDINNTRKLLSLIYINMAPLHEPPFDLMLIAYANKIFWSNA